MKVPQMKMISSLDTFDVSSVNSASLKQILKKGSHYMPMLRSTPLFISPVFAGALPSRSAPFDR